MIRIMVGTLTKFSPNTYVNKFAFNGNSLVHDPAIYTL